MQYFKKIILCSVLALGVGQIAWADTGTISSMRGDYAFIQPDQNPPAGGGLYKVEKEDISGSVTYGTSVTFQVSGGQATNVVVQK